MTYEAVDAAGNRTTVTQTVTVIDKTPPRLSSISATPAVLWPVNHQLVGVVVDYAAPHNCGEAACALVVGSNEPVNGTGDGDTAPDWEILGPHQVRLRVERAGSGSGRVYTIAVSCSDTAGNTSTGLATVTVPRGKK